MAQKPVDERECGGFVHTNWGPRMDENEPFPTPGAPRKMKRFMVHSSQLAREVLLCIHISKSAGTCLAGLETRKNRTGSTTARTGSPFRINLVIWSLFPRCALLSAHSLYAVYAVCCPGNNREHWLVGAYLSRTLTVDGDKNIPCVSVKVKKKCNLPSRSSWLLV